MKKAVAVLGGIVLVAGSVASASASQGVEQSGGAMLDLDGVQSTALTEPEIEATLDLYEAQGVEPVTRSELGSQMRAGNAPLSMTSGHEPVEEKVSERNGNLETLSTYADGSIAVTLVQTEAGAFDAAALGSKTSEAVEAAMAANDAEIRDCTILSGPGAAVREDCVVSGSNGVQAMSFRADYSIVSGAFDSITRTASPAQVCAGAVCDTPVLGSFRGTETSTQNAEAEYLMRWTAAGAASGTSGLVLQVGGDSAVATFRTVA